MAKTNWYQRTNTTPLNISNSTNILLSILWDAGKNPSKPIEDLTMRFQDVPPENLQQAVQSAVGMIQQKGGNLNEAQMAIVQQLQQMASGVDPAVKQKPKTPSLPQQPDNGTKSFSEPQQAPQPTPVNIQQEGTSLPNPSVTPSR